MKLPIFGSTFGNVGKSLLTPKFNGLIPKSGPVGIFDIAKEHQLEDVFVCDRSMAGYIKLYKNALEAGVNLRFGSRIKVSHNSLDDDHNFGCYDIFAKNTDGYYDLIKINSLWAEKNVGNKQHEYITFNELKQYLIGNKNLYLMVPFYDSFLFNNNFIFFGSCIPDFSDLNPIFCIENHNTIYDHTLQPIVKQYCKDMGFEILETHKIYYYRDADFDAYLQLRASNNKGSWFKPELSHFSSNEFSYESYERSTA